MVATRKPEPANAAARVRATQALVLVEEGLVRTRVLQALRRLEVVAIVPATVEEALACARRLLLDVMVVGARTACAERPELVPELRSLEPGAPVVLACSDGRPEAEACRLEAYDCVRAEEESLLRALPRALEHRALTLRLAELERQNGQPLLTALGTGAQAERAVQELDRAAGTDYNVVLHLEDGMGAESAARRMHGLSARSAGHFVLFDGARDGAGRAWADGGTARAGRRGVAADPLDPVCRPGDTIFLQGLDRLTRPDQARVLRILEGPRGATARPRIIASTAVAPEVLVASGCLRADLFRHVNELLVCVLPIRERPDDLARLARTYLVEAAEDLRKPLTGFAQEALDLILDCPWRGNSAELRGIVRRAGVLAQRLVGRGHVDLARNATDRVRIPGVIPAPAKAPRERSR